MKAEAQQTPCPSQRDAVFPEQQKHVCVWRTDTWSRWRMLKDWVGDAYTRALDDLEKRFGWDFKRRSKRYGGTFWPMTEPRPRTCSYCGGLHPDDAVLLVLRGWDVETTSKSYKRYLHPPGWSQAMASWYGGGSFEERSGKLPRSPVPPAKLYVWHFDDRHVEAFNAAIRSQDAKETTH